MRRPDVTRRSDGTILVERFSLARRVEHLAVIFTFVILVLSGFPQRFYDAPWAAPILSLFGGLDDARLIHRIAGVAFAVQAVVHMTWLLIRTLAKKIRLTMLPTPQDLRDAWRTLGYYLGFKKKPPKFGKFDYRQKFEYIGIIFGGLVMIFSGFVLLFPMTVAYIVPGQVIAAAREAHSNEAMLALSVLVIWHLYGSHLSPEVFPVDRCMFTGYLTIDELKERHALEYERLFPDGPPELPAEEPAAKGPGGR